MQFGKSCIAATALVSVLAACSTSPPSADGSVHQCEDPRPQVCTLEYAPVCAFRGGGERREYSNGCSACADPEVSGYTDGACASGNG